MNRKSFFNWALTTSLFHCFFIHILSCSSHFFILTNFFYPSTFFVSFYLSSFFVKLRQSFSFFQLSFSAIFSVLYFHQSISTFWISIIYVTYLNFYVLSIYLWIYLPFLPVYLYFTQCNLLSRNDTISRNHKFRLFLIFPTSALRSNQRAVNIRDAPHCRALNITASRSPPSIHVLYIPSTHRILGFPFACFPVSVKLIGCFNHLKRVLSESWKQKSKRTEINCCTDWNNQQVEEEEFPDS